MRPIIAPGAGFARGAAPTSTVGDIARANVAGLKEAIERWRQWHRRNLWDDLFYDLYGGAPLEQGSAMLGTGERRRAMVELVEADEARMLERRAALADYAAAKAAGTIGELKGDAALLAQEIAAVEARQAADELRRPNARKWLSEGRDAAEVLARALEDARAPARHVRTLEPELAELAELAGISGQTRLGNAPLLEQAMLTAADVQMLVDGDEVRGLLRAEEEATRIEKERDEQHAADADLRKQVDQMIVGRIDGIRELGERVFESIVDLNPQSGSADDRILSALNRLKDEGVQITKKLVAEQANCDVKTVQRSGTWRRFQRMQVGDRPRGYRRSDGGIESISEQANQ